MKNNKKRLNEMIFNFLFLLIIGGFLANNIVGMTYAIADQEPNLIITINKDGQFIQNGNLFGDELWYPGKTESGVIRIINQYKNVNITNLGLDVKLKAYKTEYDKEVVYNSFLDNMKMTIEKGTLLVFNTTILNNESIIKLVNKSDDDRYNGFELEESNQLSISKDHSIDLKYTLYMDAESGEELEGLNTSVDLLINFE